MGRKVRTKQELLAELQESLAAGIITEADLKTLITQEPAAAVAKPEAPKSKRDKFSVVDGMFYVAGIVLFSALMSFIAQSGDEGNAVAHILLSLGVGAALWAGAYALLKSPEQTDVRRGLANSMLLTGALSVIVGGFIVTYEFIGNSQMQSVIPAAITLAVLGALHIAFDRLVKKDLILLLGIFLSVAAFPALLVGLLQESQVALDVWAVVAIGSAGLLAYATRVVAKMNPDRPDIKHAFDGLAAFAALMSMYAASYSERGVLWLLVLILSVLGLFYVSIIAKNKQFLGAGSFFMILTVITISFKYFSGFGVTVSLVLAAMGLLGSAAVASSINKKYFKQPAQTPHE